MNPMQTRREFLATSLGALGSISSLQSAPRVDRKVLAEARSDKETYRVVSVTNGEGAWCEIRKVNPATGAAQVLSQDEILFTNGGNDGGAAVPIEVKRTLAAGYAQSLIDAQGGVKGYSLSIRQSAAYGVPLPTGLLREALIRKGVVFPDYGQR
jgi:hypothetical protein